MHVKRHLSRLFGSLRRKDNKAVSEKVLQQLQSRDQQTSSRWELLDPERDEDVNTIRGSETSDLKHGKTFKRSDKTGSLSPSSHEVQVQLTLHKNSKRRKNAKFPDKNADEQSIPDDRNGCFYEKWDRELATVSSVVQEINETISLINEFTPKATGPGPIIQSSSGLGVTGADGKSPIVSSLGFWEDDPRTSNEGTQKRNNLDTISRVEEGTRLTRGIWSQSLERDVINLPLNEEMGATVFVVKDEDREPDDYPNWLLSAPYHPREIGTLANASSSSKSASRPGAAQWSLRSSGRRLVHKIHKRFNKKSEESPENERYEEDEPGSYSPVRGGGGVAARTTTIADMSTSIPPTNPSTIKEDDACKGNEIKSIGGGGGGGGESSPDHHPLVRTKSSRAGNLTRSFRKVISFPHRSSFQPLDNNTLEQEVEDEKKRIQEVRAFGERDDSTALRRKPSFRALRKPGNGMKKILMKTVTSFGKSMVHASAVMPMEYECPHTSRNYEEPYWTDEDDFNDFRRRYCRSSDVVEEYQDRVSRNSRMNGFYQHGYCYNG